MKNDLNNWSSSKQMEDNKQSELNTVLEAYVATGKDILEKAKVDGDEETQRMVLNSLIRTADSLLDNWPTSSIPQIVGRSGKQYPHDE